MRNSIRNQNTKSKAGTLPAYAYITKPPYALVTHRAQDVPRKVADSASSQEYLGVLKPFLRKNSISHKTFLGVSRDRPGTIIGRSCDGYSVTVYSYRWLFSYS